MRYRQEQPPMGAPKAVATPAAAPHAMKSRLLASLRNMRYLVQLVSNPNVVDLPSRVCGSESEAQKTTAFRHTHNIHRRTHNIHHRHTHITHATHVTHAHTDTHKNTHTNTQKQTHTKTNTHTHIHTYTQTNRQTNKQTNKQTHTHATRTHTHTHTHTYVRTHSYKSNTKRNEQCHEIASDKNIFIIAVNLERCLRPTQHPHGSWGPPSHTEDQMKPQTRCPHTSTKEF